MEFFTQLFSDLSTADSLWVILWLIIAALIGFFTAYFYWQSDHSTLMNDLENAEKENAELRIRNTELLLNHDEDRKKINGSENDTKLLKEQIEKLRREKGQLYADLTMSKKEFDELKLKGYTNQQEAYDSEIPETEVDIPEVFLENVMKATSQLTTLKNPEIIVDAESALKEKKSNIDGHRDAADFIKNAIGTTIKSADGKKDNLQRIKGIGPFIESKLNKLGINTFEQISALDQEHIGKLTDAIQFFPGRIQRDNWVGQAMEILSAE